jgi:hypothetical protein
MTAKKLNHRQAWWSLYLSRFAPPSGNQYG